jgi:hypothetical protein
MTATGKYRDPVATVSSRTRSRRDPMRRFGRMIGCGILVGLSACSGGSSSPSATHASSSPPSATSPTASIAPVDATTPFEGTWTSSLNARSLERRGFTSRQIRLFQAQDGWSTEETNEIRIEGDTWVLWQGVDGQDPTQTGNHGRVVSVTAEQIRLDDGGVCFHLLDYRLQGDRLQMSLVRSTCDDVPVDAVPDFMYDAVFGQPYHRRG